MPAGVKAKVQVKTAQVIPAPSEAEKEQIRQIIRDVFGNQAEKAIKIVEFCESGLNPNAVNYGDAKITGYPSWGLFMHNGPEFAGWNDPLTSTKMAWDKYSRRGWKPWYNCAKKYNLI